MGAPLFLQEQAFVIKMLLSFLRCNRGYRKDAIQHACGSRLKSSKSSMSNRLASPAQRHPVERCFSKPNKFRRVATRFEKTARNCRAVITFAGIMMR